MIDPLVCEPTVRGDMKAATAAAESLATQDPNYNVKSMLEYIYPQQVFMEIIMVNG